MLSRAFFLPGDIPPITHLGCTLFRHCCHSAWRYARYHLGLSISDRAPVVFVQLRPYFEGSPEEPLEDLMLSPGASTPAQLSAGVRAGFGFHRLRLGLRRRSLATSPADAADPDSDSWSEMQDRVSRWIPALGDALITDMGAVNRRRRLRSNQKIVPPCSSPAVGAGEYRGSLPSPDVGVAPGGQPAMAVDLPAPDPPRGAFRDVWVSAASDLRPRLLAFGQGAVERKVLDEPDEVFFLPFNHLDVLAGDQRLEWIRPAALKNRAEWLALAESAAPAEALETRNVGLRLRSRGASGPALACVLQPLA